MLFIVRRDITCYIAIYLSIYLTKYKENGERYAESWLQLNLFGRVYCFSRRKLVIEKTAFDMQQSKCYGDSDSPMTRDELHKENLRWECLV